MAFICETSKERLTLNIFEMLLLDGNTINCYLILWLKGDGKDGRNSVIYAFVCTIFQECQILWVNSMLVKCSS